MIYFGSVFERFLFVYDLITEKDVVKMHPGGEVQKTGIRARSGSYFAVIATSYEEAHNCLMSRYKRDDPEVVHCQMFPISGEVAGFRYH